MARDLLKAGEGRFFRGNLHCHSDRSDGQRSPEYVVGAYRDAGYDFICLSDHFEAEYGWQVTDTRPLRDEGFTTIVGAELSSAPWDDRHAFWVTAAGLPVDFETPPADDHAGAIMKARETGAFVVMLHPGLNNLPLAAADRLPALDAVHAVEVYNHHLATLAHPDAANGAYMLDGLLEGGRRLLVNAGDDAHFDDPKDRFGGWIEVHSEHLDPGFCWPRSRPGATTRRRDPPFASCRWTTNGYTFRRAKRTRSRCPQAATGGRAARKVTARTLRSPKPTSTSPRSAAPIAESPSPMPPEGAPGATRSGHERE